MRLLCLAALCALLYSCSPRITPIVSVKRDPLPPEFLVEVLTLTDTLPSPLPVSMKLLGSVGTEASDFNVGWTKEKVITAAKQRAARMGGNVIKITWENDTPAPGLSYQMVGDVFFATGDMSELLKPVAVPQGTATATVTSPEGVKYTVVNDGTVSSSKRQLHRGGGMRVGFEAGPSYRVGKAAPGAEDFANKLRLGFVYGADLHYFFPFGLGVGGKFAGRHYSHTVQGIKDVVNTFYVGPSVKFRLPDYSGRAWVFGWSMGYLNFKETITGGSGWYGDSEFADANSSGISSSLDVGYEVPLGGGSDTMLGFKLSLTGGSVDLKYDDQTMKENVSALEFTIGVRF